MTEKRTKPEKAFKVGAVRAAIWVNPRVTMGGKSFNSHKVIIERTYKDGERGFKTTGSLDTNDVPKAILALWQAHQYLMAPGQKQTYDNDFETLSRAAEPIG